MLAREIPHKGGRTFGYRVSDGRSTFTYMPDHCPTSFGAGPDGCGEYHPGRTRSLRAESKHTATRLATADTGQVFAAEGRFGHAAADYAVELGRPRRRASAAAHHRPDRTDSALDALKERYDDTSGVEVIVAAQDSVLQL